LPEIIEFSRYTSTYSSAKFESCIISNIKPKVYDGKEYTPTPKVTLLNEDTKKIITLKEGLDYRLEYTNNITVGTGTVTVNGIGNYIGSKSQTFNITRKSIKKLKIVTSTIGVGDTISTPICVYDGSKLLIKGTDYDYTISTNDVQKKGTAKIIVTAIENAKTNYTGSIVAKVPVIEANNKTILKAENVTLETYSYVYDGKSHKPKVKIQIGDRILNMNIDYKVQYKNNKNVGNAYVIVTGKKDYTGKVLIPYTIEPNGQEFDVNINKGKSVIYNGKLQKPSVVVKMNGKKLTVRKDYTLIYTNHFNVGTNAKVTIRGIGNYEGVTKEAYFTIESQEIKKASIKAKSQSDINLTYQKKRLVKDVDYVVTVGESAGKNKVFVTLNGIGNFKGTKTIKVKVN